MNGKRLASWLGLAAFGIGGMVLANQVFVKTCEVSLQAEAGKPLRVGQEGRLNLIVTTPLNQTYDLKNLTVTFGPEFHTFFEVLGVRPPVPEFERGIPEGVRTFAFGKGFRVQARSTGYMVFLVKPRRPGVVTLPFSLDTWGEPSVRWIPRYSGESERIVIEQAAENL